MENGSTRLATLDSLPQVEMPQLARQAEWNRLRRCAIGSAQTALTLSANSIRHDQNRETFLIRILWLCCVWGVAAAYARVFL